MNLNCDCVYLFFFKLAVFSLLVSIHTDQPPGYPHLFEVYWVPYSFKICAFTADVHSYFGWSGISPALQAMHLHQC
jgi:hypothetical protein